MQKLRLQELLLAANQTSVRLQTAISSIEERAINSAKDASPKERVELYQWISDHMRDKLATLQTFRLK
jgi:hypothetical protein